MALNRALYGLGKPKRVAPSARTDAGYRLYTARDAARLVFIRRAQALGFSLTEIATTSNSRWLAGSGPIGP